MEKGPSTSAEYWTSEYAEVKHFKHAKEFGLDKITDYSKAATKFGKSEDENLKIFRQGHGHLVKNVQLHLSMKCFIYIFIPIIFRDNFCNMPS